MSAKQSYQVPKELLQAQRLANMSDTAVRLPVVGIELGLDFILGLIPVVGDAIMLMVSLRIIHIGKKLGMPKPLVAKMVRNAGIDMALGFVPLIGDIADIFYKANKTNVRMIEQWWVTQNKSAVDQYTAKQLQEWEARHDSERKD